LGPPILVAQQCRKSASAFPTGSAEPLLVAESSAACSGNTPDYLPRLPHIGRGQQQWPRRRGTTLPVLSYTGLFRAYQASASARTYPRCEAPARPVPELFLPVYWPAAPLPDQVRTLHNFFVRWIWHRPLLCRRSSMQAEFLTSSTAKLALGRREGERGRGRSPRHPRRGHNPCCIARRRMCHSGLPKARLAIPHINRSGACDLRLGSANIQHRQCDVGCLASSSTSAPSQQLKHFSPRHRWNALQHAIRQPESVYDAALIPLSY
jgi:hypothetical protein